MNKSVIMALIGATVAKSTHKQQHMQMRSRAAKLSDTKSHKRQLDHEVEEGDMMQEGGEPLSYALVPEGTDVSDYFTSYPQVSMYTDGPVDMSNPVESINLYLDIAFDANYEKYESCYVVVTVDSETGAPTNGFDVIADPYGYDQPCSYIGMNFPWIAGSGKDDESGYAVGPEGVTYQLYDYQEAYEMQDKDMDKQDYDDYYYDDEEKDDEDWEDYYDYDYDYDYEMDDYSYDYDYAMDYDYGYDGYYYTDDYYNDYGYGDYYYMDSEYDPYYGYEEPQQERGMMEEAQGWLEDTFGMDSANKMLVAVASLVTVAAVQL